MILTCPQCATRYFVADEKLGPEGRAVKCASCGTRWTAVRDPEPMAEPVVEAPTVVEAAPEAAAEASPATVAADVPLSKQFRNRKATEKKIKEAAAFGIIWAGMAGVLALLLVAALAFRLDIVRIWPKTATAYAGIGLPVNSLGLVIEGLKAEPTLQEGRAALVITGTIRNIRNTPVAAPPVKIALLDPKGQRVAGKVAGAVDATIPGLSVRHFAITLLDPPTNARDLEVQFDASAIKSEGHGAKAALRGPVDPHAAQGATSHQAAEGHAAEQAHPAAEAHAAEEPTALDPSHVPEAKPLPAGSPHALEPAHGEH
jgi:predicted Zn finger-like uncharacterized protein